MGTAEAEAAFAARIAQPLLLQEPLQAVLLDLFRQLHAQGAAVEGLQAALGAAEEREQAAAACSEAALRQLEARLAAERQAAAQAAADTAERLRRLELRLHGASNVAGRQAALDDIASMLGVSVPEVGAARLSCHACAVGIQAQRVAGDTVNSSCFLAACTSLQVQMPATAAPPGALPDSFMHIGSGVVAGADAAEAGSAACGGGTGADASFTAASAARSSTPLPPATAQQHVWQAESASGTGSAPSTALADARHSSAGSTAAGSRPASRAVMARSSSSTEAARLSPVQAGTPPAAVAHAEGQAAGPAAAAASASAPVAAPAAAQRPATPSTAKQPAGSSSTGLQAAELAPPAHAGQAPGAARPKSGERKGSSIPLVRLAEVVHMLRKRPSLKQTGLLWKLQASLAESVAEQERLRGEVVSLQEQLGGLQSASREGLAHCNKRIDGVEEAVAAAAALESSSDGSLPTVRSLAPRVAVEEFKALEARVGALGGQVAAGAAGLASLEGQARAEAQKLCQLEGRVQSGEQRLGRLEERGEAEAAAVKLVRASSSGSREDTLDALRGHLLVQQQRLQERMEGLASGIKQALPAQVHDAVTGAVVEVGRGLERRLAEKLATKQDLQTLSIKMGSKVSREEVERMLRAHLAALPGAAEPGSGPAAGMRFKCLSCDSDMQPFVFAAPPGALPFPHQPHTGGTADLRYSQLPVASPPRSTTQPWTAAAAPMGGAAAAGPEASASRLGSTAGVGGGGSVASSPSASASQLPAAHVQLQQAPLSARPSTGASRLGAPISWMHRMRRETGASQEASGHGSRRESVQEQHLQHQPSLTAVAIARPQSAFPPPAGAVVGSGGATPRSSPGGSQQRAADWQHQKQADGASANFFDAIREEPMAGGAPSATVAAVPSAGGELAEAVSGPRSRASLASGGSSKSVTGLLPALAASPGRIKAVRPATAALAVAGGEEAPAEGDAPQRSSPTGGANGPGSKRQSTSTVGSTAL
ncbi:hypothetical protein ABPG75_008706 [Micractinium tetrahymenae]